MTDEFIAHISNPAGLYIDFENIYFLLRNEPFHLLEDEALSATMDLLVKLRARFNEENLDLIIERAYADWENIPNAQRPLQISGVLPRYVDSRKEKSSADIELSLDMMQQLLIKEGLRHFILVGGDRDYLPILRRVKEHKRHLIVASFSHSYSGDVAEFVENYRYASFIKLDDVINPHSFKTRAEVVAPPASGNGGRARQVSQIVGEGAVPPSRKEPFSEAEFLPPDLDSFEPLDEDKDYDWELRYLHCALRFLNEHDYNEIHLGPFFRWLAYQTELQLLSTREQREIFDRLKKEKAVYLEERPTEGGYAFTVMHINYNHPLVHRAAN